MQIWPERLEAALEKSLAPVYLVAGPEPLLVQEARDLILAAARQHGFLERTIHQVNGKSDWAEIRASSEERSLFSSRKVIDLRLASGKPGLAGAKVLGEWSADSDPDVLLVLSCEAWDTTSRKSKWAAEMTQAGALVEIKPVKAPELPAWIEGRMRKAGLHPEREAVGMLADLVEGNLLAAQQEIDKLVLLDPGSKITAQMIRDSVANNSRFDAFRLCECLLDGRAAECLKVASGLERTGVAIQAVGGALSYQLGQVSAARSAFEAGEDEARTFSRLRIFKPTQAAFRAAVRRLPESRINDAFRALTLIDLQGKGRAQGDPWQTLDDMLLALCESAGRAPARRAARG